ncbi:MAG: hypothetical protein IJZ68_09595 [Bacteroidaceae bacterium]|nr:hypothetical protein [Bacteroidaceae bacterium]
MGNITAAYYNNKYWAVSVATDDNNFVDIWRYQPEEGCTEGVTRRGAKYYEKRVSIHDVQLLDFHFQIMSNGLFFTAEPSKDETSLIIKTDNQELARQYHLDPIVEDRGQDILWAGFIPYDKCQEFHVTITCYAASYILQHDIGAWTEEKKQLTKDEWIELQHLIEDSTLPLR